MLSRRASPLCIAPSRVTQTKFEDSQSVAVCVCFPLLPPPNSANAFSCHVAARGGGKEEEEEEEEEKDKTHEEDTDT
eukprot:4484296-Pyramimonas_sp.AAC.1